MYCSFFFLLTLSLQPLVQVYTFVFDERYGTLSAQGSAFNLTDWYSQDIPRMSGIHIVGNSDELALIQDSGKVRVFSTVAQQFRSVTLSTQLYHSADD